MGSSCLDSIENSKTAQCISGTCATYACEDGYTFWQGACVPLSMTDADGCAPGTIWRASSPSSGSCVSLSTWYNCGAFDAQCRDGYCIGDTCYPDEYCEEGAGYRRVDGDCVLNGPVLLAAAPSQRARARRRTLFNACPGSVSLLDRKCRDADALDSGGTACPIYGSDAAFTREQASGFASSLQQDLTGMQRAGYECVDTATSLDDCGGCSSMDFSACTAPPLR